MAATRKADSTQSLVNQLQADNHILQVGAITGPPFHIQRTLLASVSKELANDLEPGRDGICRLITTTYEALRIFFAWLLRYPIRTRSQELLAQSWRFGARYHIPTYQNEVMRTLVDVLRSEPVNINAVRDAYVNTDGLEPRIAKTITKRDHLLRKAFVTQLASDCRKEYPWEQDEQTYFQSGLEKNRDFHEDLAKAICFGLSRGDAQGGGARIEELLVDEPGK